jgi:hypothetical protein
MLGREFSFHDMEIGAANATGAHPQENLAGGELRIWDVRDLEWA